MDIMFKHQMFVIGINNDEKHKTRTLGDKNDNKNNILHKKSKEVLKIETILLLNVAKSPLFV